MSLFSKRNINTVLLAILVLICAIFPNDIYSLKKISFGFLILLNINEVFRFDLSDDLNKIVFFIGGFFPIILLIQGLIMGVPFGVLFSRVYCCFLLLLLQIIRFYDIDYKKIFMLGIFAIILLTMTIFLMDFLGVVDVNSSFPLKRFIYNNDIGFMGKHSSYAAYYKIFIKTSPLIVFYMFSKLEVKNYVGVVVSYICLIISGTRGNFVFSGLLLIIYLIFMWKCKSRKEFLVKFLLVSTSLFVVLINFKSLFINLHQMIIEKGEVSDAVRSGHYQGLIEMWDNNPFSFFIGTGMGSSFYSYGIMGYVNTIELPYLDLLRQMGLLLLLFFLYFTFLPVLKLKYNRPLQFAYISYLLIAATNPLLFSSTAFLVYIYIYMELINHKENVKSIKENRSKELVNESIICDT